MGELRDDNIERPKKIRRPSNDDKKIQDVLAQAEEDLLEVAGVAPAVEVPGAEAPVVEPVVEAVEVVVPVAPVVEEKEKQHGKQRGKRPRPQAAQEESSGMIEKVVAINRITKVTKGGKKLSFSALVVVGDAQGNVGYSLEKAAEVSIAIRKALASAKRQMIKVPMKGSTIPHEVVGECGAAQVLLKPAGEGTGVIASGPVRAICDGAGIHNILTKCHRSNNPINVIKATMNGLTRLKSANVNVVSN